MIPRLAILAALTAWFSLGGTASALVLGSALLCIALERGFRP